MKPSLENIVGKVRGIGGKIKTAVCSPRGVRLIKVGLVATPFAIAGIKIAYALLTGDHSQTADTHKDLQNGGDQIQCLVANNPHMAAFDANSNGIIEGHELGNYIDHCIAAGIDPQAPVYSGGAGGFTEQIMRSYPNDAEKIAQYDADRNGAWDIGEFRNYLNAEHYNDQEKGGLDLIEYSDAALEQLKVAMGGRFVPYRLE